ncbi:hypothetical protein ACROYT_G037280 [Oculina patagonica]
MNPAIYLVAFLAFCALPSALGLTCYECTANETTGELCHNMANYTMKNCSGANAMCAITKIMTVGVPLSAYLLDCFETPITCSGYNTSLCQNVETEAGNKNRTISACMTTCCETDKCNVVPVEPTTTMAMSSTTVAATGTTTMAPTTTDAADVFRPQLMGLLFIVLSAVYFGVQ